MRESRRESMRVEERIGERVGERSRETPKSSLTQVYASFFKEPYPARAAFAVADLPKYGLVEIEAVAVVGDIQDKQST